MLAGRWEVVRRTRAVVVHAFIDLVSIRMRYTPPFPAVRMCGFFPARFWSAVGCRHAGGGRSLLAPHGPAVLPCGSDEGVVDINTYDAFGTQCLRLRRQRQTAC